MRNQFFRIAPKGGDPDAQTFITAAGITDSTQKSAITQLVVDLKAANIWTKFRRLIPLVGGTASSCAVNLKSPGTFDVTWFNGPVFNSSGVTFNSSSYGEFGLIPSAINTLDSHISFYKIAGTGGYFDVGSLVGGSYGIIAPYTDLRIRYYFTNGELDTMVTNAFGDYAVNTLPTGPLSKNYDNGVVMSPTSANAVQSAITGQVRLGGFTGGPGSNSTYSFFTEGVGLTDAEQLARYNAIQKFQTSLGRQV